MMNDYKLFLSNLDLGGHELRNFVVQVLATDPDPKLARVYFNSASKCLRIYNGTEWEDVGSKMTIDPASGETVISVDKTDAKNLKLLFNISATQGTGVNVSKEADGIKVEVQDGNTTKKGIIQLATPASRADYNDETKGITPKGALVDVEEQTTPESGYAHTYIFKQGGLQIIKINLEKEKFLQRTFTRRLSDYAVNTAYSKDDMIINANKAYRVLADIEASDNTKFEDVETIEATIDTPKAGDQIIVLVVVISGETAETYLYIKVEDMGKVYKGDDESIKVEDDGTIKLLNDSLTPDTKAVARKVKFNKFGLPTELGDIVKTHKKLTTTIAVGNTSATITLPAGSDFINAFTSVNGEEVITGVKVTKATSEAAGSVEFSIAEAYTEIVDCEVNIAEA